MIIWGWRKTKKICGRIGNIHCTHCGNDGEWQLIRVISWFTLFFIPVIPYRWQYFATCPVCNYGSKLSREKYKEMLAEIKDSEMRKEGRIDITSNEQP